jgi:prepilin-type N-terminal cleavage/methylation domain-containing protein
MKTNVSLRIRAALSSKPAAFTLIELLVVIAIIALLAGIATPIYQTAMLTAQQTAAMQNARQIGLAAMAWANDQGGVYMSGTNTYGEQIQTSNDAFRELIPTYLDNEKVFVVPHSNDGPTTNNIIDPYTSILTPGENHWAYIEGLSTTSNSTWPLIVDSANSQGCYTTDQSQPGGVWKGTKAIVINIDGSSHEIPLLGTGTSRYIPQPTDNTQNALDVSSYMGSNAQLLEPAASN